MVWTSPERHGAMTGIMKAQIDWIPLNLGSVRPTQGKTLAVMEVSGGSQSFNAVNQLRILGRWMSGGSLQRAARERGRTLEADQSALDLTVHVPALTTPRRSPASPSNIATAPG